MCCACSCMPLLLQVMRVLCTRVKQRELALTVHAIAPLAPLILLLRSAGCMQQLLDPAAAWRGRIRALRHPGGTSRRQQRRRRI